MVVSSGPVVAATTTAAVTTTTVAASFSTDHGGSGGDRRVESPGNSSKGDSYSLLNKYTFRETVKTVVEEEHLPELPEFLEAIGLRGRLEVYTRESVM